MPKTKPPAQPFQLQFACPGCDKSAILRTRPPKTIYDWECDECDFEGEALIVTVRAKRSKINRLNGHDLFQTLNVRVIDLNDNEHHFELPLKGRPDLEMRSGDLMVFFFDAVEDASLTAVCNTTIRSSAQVQIYKSPKRGCAMLIAIGVLLVSAGFAAAMLR